MQTSSLDLLRRRQIYAKQAALKKGSSIEYVSDNRIFTDADGFGTEPAAGDSPGEQRLEGDHRSSQRAIGRALRHRQHRDRRQGHKNLCKPNANELARFAEAPPSLSNQAQDEYQRLMNNKSPKSKRK